MIANQQVIDEVGTVHTLCRRIGVGGQGEVWLAEGGRRIVKFLKQGNDSDAMRRQFAFVRRLDLSELHVARPLAVLKPPHVGYVAEFLGEMESIKALIDAPVSYLLQWYLSAGGLRRRLRLLAHAGEALMGLHARGVVYADISHHNVFVSKPVDACEAWLIDLDNLKYESEPSRTIYTPGYGAPEVVSGSAGCTSLSDAWAFAVLIWQVLTLTHPFVGDLVNDGEPEMEEQAFAGKIPWTRHSGDRRNSCSLGLPPDLVLASRLVELARRTFEDGLLDRQKRPGVSEWVDRLHVAADQAIMCRGCSGTYFVSKSCPWCGEAAPSIIPFRIVRWQPGKGLVEGAARLGRLPVTSEGLELPRRITQGLSGLTGREAHVRVMVVERGISVQTLPGFKAWVAPVAKALEEKYPVQGRARILPPNGWMIFFEEPELPQRVALLGRT